MGTRINDMIKDSQGRKKELLKQLKKLNLLALKNYFLAPGHVYGHSFKQKYQALQRSEIWKKAKQLTLEYKKECNIYTCSECGRPIRSDRCTLHHREYDQNEIFSPCFVSLIHNGCHGRIHK